MRILYPTYVWLLLAVGHTAMAIVPTTKPPNLKRIRQIIGDSHPAAIPFTSVYQFFATRTLPLCLLDRAFNHIAGFAAQDIFKALRAIAAFRTAIVDLPEYTTRPAQLTAARTCLLKTISAQRPPWAIVLTTEDAMRITAAIGIIFSGLAGCNEGVATSRRLPATILEPLNKYIPPAGDSREAKLKHFGSIVLPLLARDQLYRTSLQTVDKLITDGHWTRLSQAKRLQLVCAPSKRLMGLVDVITKFSARINKDAIVIEQPPSLAERIFGALMELNSNISALDSQLAMWGVCKLQTYQKLLSEPKPICDNAVWFIKPTRLTATNLTEAQLTLLSDLDCAFARAGVYPYRYGEQWHREILQRSLIRVDTVSPAGTFDLKTILGSKTDSFPQQLTDLVTLINKPLTHAQLDTPFCKALRSTLDKHMVDAFGTDIPTIKQVIATLDADTLPTT